ncbi:hypothetical protein WN51_04425 [Melipona quadrifasciata]|uniref:Uncharacterized protein n=1 Tax=Melipona quadrifasciata TaxID=166423 RepID=A0A0N0BD49_9HYME|nr:hypothetical protein WN51_04425 [Melipona quadrifasciata]
MGDPTRGQTLFLRMCVMCRRHNKDERHEIGSPLSGVVGRTSGSMYGIFLFI